MNPLSKIALVGLLGGTAALVGTGCKKEQTSTPPAKTGEDAAKKYSEVHDCAGLNSCKGIGGCKVDEVKLVKLAAEAGVSMDKAGHAHECKGLNECKGLGGCHIDQATVDGLKAKKGG